MAKRPTDIQSHSGGSHYDKDPKRLNRKDTVERCGSGLLAEAYRRPSNLDVFRATPEDILNHDSIANALVTRMIYDALSNWRKMPDVEFKTLEEELRTDLAMQEAWRLARTFGESVIYPVIVDADDKVIRPTVPLDDVVGGRIVRLMPMQYDEHDDNDGKIIGEIESKWYGRPKFVKLSNKAEDKVHATRLAFIGNGYSYFDAIKPYLADYHECRQRKLHSQRRNAAIITYNDLEKMATKWIAQQSMAGRKISATAVREFSAEYARIADENINDYSVLMLQLGAKVETITQNNINQLVGSIEQEERTLAAAGGYPVSYIFDRTTGSLGSAESEKEKYKLSADSYRAREVEPCLHQLDHIFSTITGDPVPDWEWEEMALEGAVEVEEVEQVADDD